MRNLAIFFALLLATAAVAAPAADATLFQDSFGSYAATTDVSTSWDLTPGWTLRSGALATKAERALAVAFACPEITTGEVRATLRVAARSGAAGWAAAGLMLYQGPDHYWRLALVESPAGQHYCELVEQYAGAWQAQSAGRTALPGEPPVSAPWAFGRTYDLRISLTRDAVVGEVRASDTVIFTRAYRLPNTIPAVRSGRPALEVIAMDASFDDVIATGESPSLARDRTTPTAVILAQPGGKAVADLTAAALKQAGYQVQSFDPQALGDAQAFNRARFDLLVLTRSETIPGPGKDNLLAFLRAGGHLVAFGGPAFQTIVWPWGGAWKTSDEILSEIRADRTILDYAGADLTQWTRASSNLATPVEYKLVLGPNGQALQVHVANLTGWETFASPPLDNPFPPREALTCFWAKGDARTDYLVVEWNEHDGSRWIATVALTQDWQHYALRPEDFKFWHDSPTKDRGGPGDVFNPQNAERIVFGLAQSHAPIATGEHTYWVADVGAAPSPFPAVDVEPPTLEAMSPWYKVYETDAIPTLGRLISPIWRQRGLGTGAGQRGRWIPLVRAETPDGHYRGAAASTYFATSGPYRGATWTYIGLDPQAVRDYWPDLESAITGVARQIEDGLLLASGGSDQFSYFADAGAAGARAASPRLVARVMNIGAQPKPARILFTVNDASLHAVFQTTSSVDVGPGRMISVAADCPALPPGRYEASCLLLPSRLAPGGDYSIGPIGAIAHEFSIIAPPAKPEFITTFGGDFSLGRKPWYPHGLNFWPLYVAGLERFDYWLHWLSPSQYDPEPVQRDLATLRSLGATMVSIQYGNVDQAPALNDFLRRAKAYGIHVNVFIPGTHPLAFDPPFVESLVRAARLDQSDAVFAYDLAWEPSLGHEEQRRQWDSAWAAWIVDNYGSIEAAERDWGCAVRRLDDKPTGPTDQQLVEDGDHRRMVAAYRRFADDLISQGYGKVTRFLRRLDPHHLFGARTGYGGTGQRGVAPVMAYDLVSGAAHLDFASAEGWGLWGDWTNFERAGFTTLYGRWATNGKPMFWAEFGYTIYPGITPQKYVSQAEVYRNMYRMVLQSGANGSAGWWYPGGLRVDENSDFGVINQDGTPRLAADELGKVAPQITAPRERPAPDTWITIDRDLDVAGYAGVWERHAAAYVEAVRAGKTVALRTEGDDTTSADVPLVAVGDVPCNGSNPPKYLNAEFGEVAVLDAAGSKDAVVSDGAVIEVPAGRPVRLRAQLINSGVAAWLAPKSAKGVGGVYLAAGERAGLQARAAIPRDVPRYGKLEFIFTLASGVAERTEVTLAMRVDGRSVRPGSGQLWFGQRLRFTLAPAPR
jgi:hypothetical protein